MRSFLVLITTCAASFLLSSGFASAQTQQAGPSSRPDPTYPPATNYPAQNSYSQRPIAYPGYQGSPYDSHRDFMAGVGIGFSKVDFNCDTCRDGDTSLGFDYYIGWFLNPRLALMYDGNFWVGSESYVEYDSTQFIGLHSAALQFWVLPQVWIKGGFGLAIDRASFTSDFESESIINYGAGVTLGAGFELFRANNFAIDISGRVNAMTIEYDYPVNESGVDMNTGELLLNEQEAEVVGLSLLVGVRWH